MHSRYHLFGQGFFQYHLLGVAFPSVVSCWKVVWEGPMWPFYWHVVQVGFPKFDQWIQILHFLLLRKPLVHQINEYNTFWAIEPWVDRFPSSIWFLGIQCIQWFVDLSHNFHFMLSFKLPPKLIKDPWLFFCRGIKT